MTHKQRRKQAISRQIERLDRQLALLQHTSDQLSRWRLVVFMAGVITAVLVLLQWGVWPWLGVSGAAIAAFAIAANQHRRVETNRQRTQLWRDLKHTHLARMNLDWQHLPPPAPLDAPPDHPFALDLDLVGSRSVMHLVDTAVSQEGSARLAGWLLDTDPALEAALSRQAIVAELTAMPVFRDKLTLNAMQAAAETGEKWPGKRVLTWLETQANGRSLRPVLWLLAALALVNVTLLLLYLAGILPPLFLLSWALYGVVFITRSGDAAPIFADAYFLEKSLRQLGAVFGFLETARLADKPLVAEVCAPLRVGTERPSTYLRRVTRLLALAGLRQNPFLWLLLNGLVPWDIFVADRLRGCQAALQTRLPVWLDAWFELEALSSLASLAYHNPAAIFPAIASQPPAPFAAQALGHPLIPDETRVCNDFRIDSLGAVDIITGSNMAGKSSFLRALGVNLALAYAGGPVFAAAFSAQLFRLYTSIRVADSVTDGFSYFYAEVRRLAGLLAALEAEGEERPLFFLIDEIFRGTNNRERLVGSQAYVRALVGQNGVGLIATHDLELVQLAESSPFVRNYHFRDGVENGRMTFDYHLHPGPCPTTNALKIMALAGLPVPSLD
ncbi:MAG: hypothetical protein R6X34_23495 [Chloroflexota bacterium]